MVKATSVLATLIFTLSTASATWIPKIESRGDDTAKAPHKGDWMDHEWKGDWGNDKEHGHNKGSEKGKDWGKEHGWAKDHGHGGDKGDGGHKGGKDCGDKNWHGKDPDCKDGKGKDPVVIPDPIGPDPNTEVITPELIQLIIDNEATAPKPDLVIFDGDEDETFVPIPDDLPENYCIFEGLENPDSPAGFAAPAPDDLLDPDTCAAYYDGRNNFRRSTPNKRTYASTGSNRSPNRWRRGSVISICVEKNFDWMVTYNGVDLRASQVIAGATFRAVNLWNNGTAEGSAGLNPRFVSFEFTTECNRAVYRVKSHDNTKEGSPNVLADCQFPPYFNPTRQKILNVYNTAFEDNYQNVLTAIQSHELGHALGIAHENCQTLDPTEPCTSITDDVSGSLMTTSMDPSLTVDFAGPLADDITGVNRYYSLAGGPGSPLGVILWRGFEGPFRG